MILGIRLGHHLGWFYGAAVGPCDWGTQALEDTPHLGRWLKSADGVFQKMIPTCNAIAIERPNIGEGVGYPVVRRQVAMLGHVHYWASFYGEPPISEIPLTTAKVTLAGHGFVKPDQLILAAGADGYDGMNDVEAGAYAIWKTHVFGGRESRRSNRRNGPVTRIAP